MEIKAKTDIGLIRSSNEDTYTILKKDEHNFIAFVCDGMGGHFGGAYAANKSVELLNDAFLKLDISKIKNIGVWLFETIQNINSLIYHESLSDENKKGMGTTLSGIVCINDEFHYAHIGDSRIYIYSENSIEQISTDHTYVNTLLLNGLITFKQAAKHPKRHVLTNALGIKKNVSVDIGMIKLKEKDNILICSDGLHNLLDDKRLLKALNQEMNCEDKVEYLMNKALNLGGNDNITIILAEQSNGN